jgi:hypothetical protein
LLGRRFATCDQYRACLTEKYAFRVSLFKASSPSAKFSFCNDVCGEGCLLQSVG